MIDIPQDTSIEVIAINRKQRLVVLSNDWVVPMGRMLCGAEDTDDPFEAEVAVCPLPDGRWIVVKLFDFVPTKLN